MEEWQAEHPERAWTDAIQTILERAYIPKLNASDTENWLIPSVQDALKRRKSERPNKRRRVDNNLENSMLAQDVPPVASRGVPNGTARGAPPVASRGAPTSTVRSAPLGQVQRVVTDI